MSILANHWAAHGHEVSVATFELPDRDYFDLDGTIRRFVIGGTGPFGPGWLRSNYRRWMALREAIQESRAQVVLSFLYTMNLLAVLAGRGLTPVVVSERTDPRYFPVEAWQGALRRVLYPKADAVVVQTRDVLDGWGRVVARRAPAFAVPNPALAPDPFTGTSPPGRPSGPLIVSAGRLDRRKGVDLLISAFARVAADHPDSSLTVLGDGPERDRLLAQVSSSGLDGRVTLPGIGDPSPTFHQADIFATATRVEGFPNALLEAMAHGLPVVATDCHSGPREIIRDGIDGYLVPVDDVAALAHALERLLRDAALRGRFGDRAREVTERFSLDRVAGLWEDVFARVMACDAPQAVAA